MPELEGGGMPSTVIEPRSAPGTREPGPIPHGYVTYPDALHREHSPGKCSRQLMTTVDPLAAQRRHALADQ